MVGHYHKLKSQRLIFVGFVIFVLYGLFGVLRLYPTIYMLFLSFTNYTLVRHTSHFIGLANYRELVRDPYFLLAMRNTVLIAAISVPVTIVLSFMLAVFYNTKLRLYGVFEFFYFLPVIMPTAAVSLIWRWMYDPSYGLFNYVLGWLGVPPVPWLVDPDIAVYAVIILWVWKWVGYYSVLFLVGLQDIPEIYRDAAKIDGASLFQEFRYVVLPLLKPVTLFILIIATTWAFKLFVPVYILTLGSQGAPGNAVRVVVYDMYQNYFTYFKVGYASAEGVMLFMLILLLTFVQIKAAGRYEM